MAMRTAFCGAAAGVLLALAARGAGEPAWRHFSVQAGTAGLAGDEIQFIKVAAGGGVWIGTMNGLSRAKDGAFSVAQGADGKPLEQAVWDVLELAGGEMLVGHSRGVASLGGKAQKGALDGATVAPLQPFAGTVWAIAKSAGKGRVVARGSDGTWADVPALKEVRAEDMVLLPEGSLWIMADGDGIYEIPASGDVAARKHHLQGVNVTAVFQDSKKRVWCPLWGGGIMMQEGESWIQHLPKEKAAVLTVVETPDGKIWAASSATGLWVYDGKAWNGMLSDEGAVSLLTLTADGRVWISSQPTGGLRFWDGKAWQTAIAGPLPVRCLTEAADGAIWVGGVLDGVHVYK